MRSEEAGRQAGQWAVEGEYSVGMTEGHNEFQTQEVELKMNGSNSGGLRCLLTALVILAALSAVSVVSADRLGDYYEFRFHSGLPGNNSGVTPEGSVGAMGAVQMAVPVAYTPTKGNYVVSANVGMTGSGFALDYHDKDVNGNLNFGIGFLQPGRGLYFSYMATSEDWEPVYNLQWQVRAEDEDWPAIAIGGMDLTNQRAASQTRPRAGDARSYYLVGTKQLGSEEHPIYLTAGFGTDRFDGLFGGACYRFDDRLALAAEYDTLGVNACVTYGLMSQPEYIPPRFRRTTNVVFFFGIADMSKLTYGLTYTKSH